MSVGAPGDPAAAPDSGGRLRRLKVVALVLILVGLGLDLGTKAWMEDLLDMDPGRPGPYGRIELVPGFLALEGTYNTGVTFGLAPGRTTEILVFTLVATLGLLVWLLATRNPSVLLHVGLALVLAGAVGNLYDRMRWTKVRDFLLVYVGEHRWPNFNVADSGIVVGVGLILVDELFLRGRRERRRGAA